MSLFQALVLGVVQGATEFIPISSSGHLTLVPFVVGWEEPSLAFDVAVHFGTLVAVVWVFREELRALARTATSWSGSTEEARRPLRLLAIGTVPAVVVGIAFESLVERAFERPVLVSLLLGVTAYFLVSTETVVEQRETDPETGQVPSRGEADVTTRDALVIGAAQAFAILPGISRSGATIGAGMRLGLARGAAARFSFLLSIPVIAGAILAQIPDMLSEGAGGASAAQYLVGILAAGVSGFYSIRWFLGLLERRGLRPFGVYCWIAMAVGVLVALARG